MRALAVVSSSPHSEVYPYSPQGFPHATPLPATPQLELLPPVCSPGLQTAPLASIDVIALLLVDKRSPQTRRAYERDLRDFFQQVPTPPLVQSFLCLPPPQIALALAQYKSRLRESCAEATINRRLAAVKSLLKFANRLGLCQTDGRNLVDGERVRAYRDTRGVDVKTIKKLLKAPAKAHGATSVRSLRDTAILLVLCLNALRRAEVMALDVGDFHFEGGGESCLWILGKGKGTQKERITITGETSAHLQAYLLACGHAGDKGPLFRNFDRNPAKRGERLTTQAIYNLVLEYGAAVKVAQLTPHKLRHSAITALLDATGGNVREVQKLSRHAKIETLIIYDDNRADVQGKMTNLLSGIFK